MSQLGREARIIAIYLWDIASRQRDIALITTTYHDSIAYF